MAAGKGSTSLGRVHCPVCGGTSTKDGHGREGTRWADPRPIPHNQDPKVTARRERAARFRAQNAGRK